MSHAWGLIRKDKNTLLMGSVWWGVGITFLVGVPLLLLLNTFEQKIPVLVGILFVVIVFPLVTFSFYKAGSKKIKKEK
jgi:hypothetical protein